MDRFNKHNIGFCMDTLRLDPLFSMNRRGFDK